jgi:hypothetical protein
LLTEARLEELALQSPNGTIDTESLRQLRLDEQVKDPVMSILTGDLLHMLLLEMCEVKVQALEVVAALEEVMKENNLNLELASIAPTILVSGCVLWGTCAAVCWTAMPIPPACNATDM